MDEGAVYNRASRGLRAIWEFPLPLNSTLALAHTLSGEGPRALRNLPVSFGLAQGVKRVAGGCGNKICRTISRRKCARVETSVKV